MNKMTEVDSQGYLLVPKEFKKGGYFYTFISQIDNDWHIYSAFSPFCKKIIDYELVRFTKSEEYELGGNIVPKKWSYPTANAFGKHGFSCGSIERCKRKHEEILKREREKSIEAPSFDIPFNEEFTVLGLSKKLNLPYSRVYDRIKEIGDGLKIVRILKNKIGRDTKVYILNN